MISSPPLAEPRCLGPRATFRLLFKPGDARLDFQRLLLHRLRRNEYHSRKGVATQVFVLFLLQLSRTV